MMSEENPISDIVRTRIRHAQRMRGLSVAAFARRTGLKRDRAYRLFDGQPFTVDDIWCIARGLGMPPTKLMPLDGANDLKPAEAALVVAVRDGDLQAIETALIESGVDIAPGLLAEQPPSRAMEAAGELRLSAAAIRAAADGIERAARALVHEAGDGADG